MSQFNNTIVPFSKLIRQISVKPNRRIWKCENLQKNTESIISFEKSFSPFCGVITSLYIWFISFVQFMNIHILCLSCHTSLLTWPYFPKWCTCAINNQHSCIIVQNGEFIPCSIVSYIDVIIFYFTDGGCIMHLNVSNKSDVDQMNKIFFSIKIYRALSINNSINNIPNFIHQSSIRLCQMVL